MAQPGLRLILELWWDGVRVGVRSFDRAVWATEAGLILGAPGMTSDNFVLASPEGAGFRLHGGARIDEGQRARVAFGPLSILARAERVERVGSLGWLWVLLSPVAVLGVLQLIRGMALLLVLFAFLLRPSGQLVPPRAESPVSARLLVAPRPAPRPAPVSTAERLERLMRNEPVSVVMALPAKPARRKPKPPRQATEEVTGVAFLMRGEMGGLSLSMLVSENGSPADIIGVLQGAGGVGLSGTGVGPAPSLRRELSRLDRRARVCFKTAESPGVELRWSVGESGSATSVEVVAQAEPDVAACLTDLVKSQLFPSKPEGEVRHLFVAQDP